MEWLRKEYINFLGDEGIKHIKGVIAEMKRRNAETRKGLDELERILKLKGLL